MFTPLINQVIIMELVLEHMFGTSTEIIAQSKKDEFYIFTNSKNINYIPKARNVKIIINKLPVKFRVLELYMNKFLYQFVLFTWTFFRSFYGQ